MKFDFVGGKIYRRSSRPTERELPLPGPVYTERRQEGGSTELGRTLNYLQEDGWSERYMRLLPLQ